MSELFTFPLSKAVMVVPIRTHILPVHNLMLPCLLYALEFKQKQQRCLHTHTQPFYFL